MSLIFQAGGTLPADHPTYVGRQADHDALHAALNGYYLHVIAPRQVGKTSLLKHLAHRLGEMEWRCAYMDLATLTDFRKPAWYAELGKALARSLTPGQIPTLANQVDLRRYLLDQALPWPDGQPRIALLLDEVEGASKAQDADGASFSDTFFSMLRALYSEREKLDSTLVVAMAGAVNPGDLIKDPDISPFNVGREIGLDDFTSTETRVLTGHLADLGLTVDESVHQAIYDWTNGHPYLTQRICAELEKGARSGGLTAITLDNVGHIVEQAILSPANPLQRDKNLRHVTKMLSRLSVPAAQLWSRLRAGEPILLSEASDDLHLELYLTGAVKAQAGRLVIRNRIYALAFGGHRATELRLLYEEYAERILIAFYKAHQDPRSAGIRAHGFPGIGLAVDAAIFSIDEFQTNKYWTSQKRWEIVAALRELIDKGYIKRTENDLEGHIHPDQWNFRLTPQGKHYAHRLLNSGRGSAPSVREEKPAQLGPKYEITITGSDTVVISDQAQVTQHFGSRAASKLPQPDLLRLQQLTNNIRQELALLKEYEDAPRYEGDPVRRARYRREIEQLRASAARYRQEYDELLSQVTDEPSAAMQDIATQLRQMDAKLDVLLTGQVAIRDDLSTLRQTFLARYDAREQTIVTAITERLNQTQLATVQAVLDALEANRLSDADLRATLDAVKQMLVVLRQRGISFPSHQDITEVISAPTLDVNHKLKVTLPIIPLLLQYEGELELGIRVNLETLWQRLVGKVLGG